MKKLVSYSKYICGLCGGHRWVRTYPRSPCFMCERTFPSRYLMFRYKIINFFQWIYYRMRLRFNTEWNRERVSFRWVKR